ncbi:MAG: hypothetical protein WCQ48_01480 [Chloroflexota bacterium]
MTEVDADMIAQAITDITSVAPLFRAEEEMKKYMDAIERVATAVGTKVDWSKSGQPPQ